MNKAEFQMLKDRLYRAQNGLKKSLESCPELEDTYIVLADGHRLLPSEIFSWLEAVRANCWKYGPPESQKRHMESIVRNQPKG